MTLHNRNKEIRRVRVDDILENPANFRTHDDLQRGAFQATVGEIGWYGYPDVFEHPEHPGKVMLVDGELRKQHLVEHYGPGAQIDVNVTDFTPAEADKALATKDPLAAMAGQDIAKEAELLRSLEAEGAEFAELIEQLAQADRIDLDPLPADVWDERHEVPQPHAELAEKWDVDPDATTIIHNPATGTRHAIAVGDPGNLEHVDRLLGTFEPKLLVTRARADTTGTAYRLYTGPAAYVFYNHNTCVETVRHLHEQGFEIRAQLIWRHETEEEAARVEYHSHHSSCFYAVRKGQSALWNGSRTESTVWDAPVPGFGALPIQVAGRPMVNHGEASHGVYDPWGGQTLGSVAIAGDRILRPSYTMCHDADHAGCVIERLMREWGQA